MFKTVIVGCDGTEAVRDAVALAERLRDPQGGRLVLVSVFPYYRNFALVPLLYTDWLEREADTDLAAAERHVSSGVPCEKQRIASPSAAAGLNDVAETLNADLIVLGPSHRGAVGRSAGRTTVQRMMHGAPCALAVAAAGEDRRGGGALVVAYDGSPEALHALRVAYAQAAATGARVRVVTALEPMVYASGFPGPIPDATYDREREQRARERLASIAASAPAGVEVETRTQWGDAAKTVIELAGNDAGLVVAGSRGYGPLRRVLAGAVSAGLLVNGRLPVLVLPRAALPDAEGASGPTTAEAVS